MPTERGKVRNETAALRVASTLALVGGILCSDPDSAVAADPMGSAPDASTEPAGDSSPTHEVSGGGLPRVLVYGAVAGLFLLVAAGLGAHKKH